jgi:DNA-binding GntR family transcriptional regulator
VEIDHGSPVAPYRQLAAYIRARIDDETFPEGQAIPSLVRLQQETGLAVTTIRRAIHLLEEERYVYSIPGRGTFVGQAPEREERPDLPREPYSGARLTGDEPTYW